MPRSSHKPKQKELSGFFLFSSFPPVLLFCFGGFLYFRLVGFVSIATFLTFVGIYTVGTVIRKRNSAIRWESSLLIFAILMILRTFNSQFFVNYFFLILISFSLLYTLVRFRRSSKIWGDLITQKSLFDFSFAFFLLVLPFTIAKAKFPNGQFAWMLSGDGTNWFTQLRFIRVSDRGNFVDLISGTSATNILTNLFTYSRESIPSISFTQDLQKMLNFQIVCTFVLICIVLRYLQSKGVSFLVRSGTSIILSQSGVVLGYASYNGYLSVALILALLMSLWHLSEDTFDRFSVYTLVNYLSIFVLILFSWSLLAPLVLSQLLYKIFESRLLKTRNRSIFLSVLGLVLVFYIFVGATILKRLDKYQWLTIPRGGLWPYSLITNIILISLFLIAMTLLVSRYTDLYLIQLTLVTATCMLLFMSYDQPSLWGPWTSYYPQKLISIFFIAFSIWLAIQLLSFKKSYLLTILIALLFFSNLQLQIPNTGWNLTRTAYENSESVSKQQKYAEMLTFVLEKVDNRQSFAFWDYFDWPAEGSANSWAGLAWEKYPGNWSMPFDDNIYSSNSSGLVGSRSYHNGDQNDLTNLCRLAEILPSNSVIYSRNPLQVEVNLNKCEIGNRTISILNK